MLSADALAVLSLIRLSLLPLSAALLTSVANRPRPSLFRIAPEPPLASSLHNRNDRWIQLYSMTSSQQVCCQIACFVMTPALQR